MTARARTLVRRREGVVIAKIALRRVAVKRRASVHVVETTRAPDSSTATRVEGTR